MRRHLVPSLLACGLLTLAMVACEHEIEQPETFGSTPNVAMGDKFFEPKVDTVAIGTTVTWTNNGDEGHTSTSDAGTWDSGTIARSKTFSRTFTAAGSFPYHCSFHGRPGGGMSGTIVVK